jgi:hypothetical protein
MPRGERNSLQTGDRPLFPMPEARALYASLGFTCCAPYYDDTCLGSDRFEFKLDAVTPDR